MTRDGTVGRSDATEPNLAFHRDIDPVGAASVLPGEGFSGVVVGHIMKAGYDYEATHEAARR